MKLTRGPCSTHVLINCVLHKSIYDSELENGQYIVMDRLSMPQSSISLASDLGFGVVVKGYCLKMEKETWAR